MFKHEFSTFPKQRILPDQFPKIATTLCHLHDSSEIESRCKIRLQHLKNFLLKQIKANPLQNENVNQITTNNVPEDSKETNFWDDFTQSIPPSLGSYFLIHIFQIHIDFFQLDLTFVIHYRRNWKEI
jgi:hypothetical protein